MQERAIHISSVNRQKIGQNKAEDFITKFDPVLKLQSNMTHEIALDKATMTYSWHNISDQYQNNQIKYNTHLMAKIHGKPSNLWMGCTLIQI